MTGRDLAILAVAYVFVGLGVTVGFHRMLTHRAFEAKPWLRATFATWGSMSVQGAVIHWVADHRRHHAFTDEEGDPHSPHTHAGDGWRGVLTGLWHSHMGWLFEHEHTSARRFAPDLRRYPAIRWVDKLFPVWVLLGLADPVRGRIGALRRLVARGLHGICVGGARTRVPAAPRDMERELGMPYVRQAAVRDQGREPRQLARRAGGPSARAGITATTPSRPPRDTGSRRFQIDPSYAVTGTLERLGLVWNVKRPQGPSRSRPSASPR